MKKRRTSATPLPFFRRDTTELPPGYRKPIRRRQLSPLEYAYWREHQIKIASLHYLNSKRFSRTGGGIPEGVDWCAISRNGNDHRRLFFLERLPPPAPSGQAQGLKACACDFARSRARYGCAPPGGGCEGGGEG